MLIPDNCKTATTANARYETVLNRSYQELAEYYGTAKERAENLKPEIVVQYQSSEIDMATLVESAKADFHKEKKRTLITALKLYVKPEKHMAYYVINGSHEGKVPY